jgi:hypothetical protein
MTVQYGDAPRKITPQLTRTRHWIRGRCCCQGLFEWLSGRGCWMPHGVRPTAARAAYRPVVFPLEFEREIPLAYSGEIQK